MNYIEIATVLFAIGGIVSLGAAIGHFFIDEMPEGLKSLVTGLVLIGVALWSWRIAEGFESFVEAFK